MKLKRFESALPEESFDLVKNAAELSGMTVRSFVAEAALIRALERMRELTQANLLELPADFNEEYFKSVAAQQKTKSTSAVTDQHEEEYNLTQAQEDFFRELTQPRGAKKKTS